MNPMNVDKSAYFNDKKRKIDFVLLVQTNMDPDRESYGMLRTYVKNLKENGLQVEEEVGLVLENFTCIKIHAPNPVLDKAIDQYKIDVSCDNVNYKRQKPFRPFGLKCFQNEVITIQPNHYLFSRAPKTFSNEKPTDYSNAERILLVEKVLSDIQFSNKDEDKGYTRLKKKGGIKTAYPLHDSTSQWNWNHDAPLTDRQILKRYWAHPLRFYQQQPLNLIEKYFGSEIGFYFAWLGFYTAMLVPAAILSVICNIWAVILYFGQEETIQKEICESDQMLCPVCPRYEICGPESLKHSCKKFKIKYILDNPATVLYSILMCFWGIIFLVLWKRKQALLKFRWNLNDVNTDNSIRPEFIKSAPISRISSVTGQVEYLMPRSKKIAAYLLTSLGYVVVCLLHILGIMAVMIVRLNLLYYGKKSKNKSFKEHLHLLEAFVSSFLTVLVMTVLDKFKYNVARKMTNWQNPRTKVGYYQNYTTKIVIFSLVDVFFPIFYLAYFKGHFYEHPGDSAQWKYLGMFKSDVCTISSCLVDLCVLLFIYCLSKNFIRLAWEIGIPLWKVFYNKISKNMAFGAAPAQWEKDYVLLEAKEGFLYSEYLTMMVQYSFMTLFIVALPIMPILALINNVLELRFDARNLLLNYRRILPKKVNGIEEWNTVVYLITVLGTISNPLLLAYSSSLIPKTIYLLRNQGSLHGYINSTLSDFDLVDYAKKSNLGEIAVEEKMCQYYGKRYPPSHSQKYEHTSDYWQELAIRTIFFVVLENLCLLVSLLLAYIIPEVPRKVEIRMLEDQRLLRDTKLQRSPSQETLLRVKRDGTVAGSSKKSQRT